MRSLGSTSCSKRYSLLSDPIETPGRCARWAARPRDPSPARPPGAAGAPAGSAVGDRHGVCVGLGRLSVSETAVMCRKRWPAHGITAAAAVPQCSCCKQTTICFAHTTQQGGTPVDRPLLHTKPQRRTACQLRQHPPEPAQFPRCLPWGSPAGSAAQSRPRTRGSAAPRPPKTARARRCPPHTCGKGGAQRNRRGLRDAGGDAGPAALRPSACTRHCSCLELESAGRKP